MVTLMDFDLTREPTLVMVMATDPIIFRDLAVTFSTTFLLNGKWPESLVGQISYEFLQHRIHAWNRTKWSDAGVSQKSIRIQHQLRDGNPDLG